MQSGNLDEVRKLRRLLGRALARPRCPSLSTTRVKVERELSVEWRAPKPVPIAQTPSLRLHASLAVRSGSSLSAAARGRPRRRLRSCCQVFRT